MKPVGGMNSSFHSPPRGYVGNHVNLFDAPVNSTANSSMSDAFYSHHPYHLSYSHPSLSSPLVTTTASMNVANMGSLPSIHPTSNNNNSAGFSPSIPLMIGRSIDYSSYNTFVNANVPISHSNNSIPFTFRVVWGASSVSSINRASLVSVMLPQQKSTNNAHTATRFTRVDESSNEYFYFKQLAQQTNDNLTHDSVGVVLDEVTSEIHILRLPVSYLLSLSDAQQFQCNSNMSNNTKRDWLDVTALREQLAQSLYIHENSHNNNMDSSSSSGHNLNAANNSDRLAMLHRAVGTIEQSASHIFEWNPPMGTNRIAAIALMLEGVLIMIAHVPMLPLNGHSHQILHDAENRTMTTTNSMNSRGVVGVARSNSNHYVPIFATNTSNNSSSTSSILNEKTAGLLPTATPFPPPPGVLLARGTSITSEHSTTTTASNTSHVNFHPSSSISSTSYLGGVADSNFMITPEGNFLGQKLGNDASKGQHLITTSASTSSSWMAAAKDKNNNELGISQSSLDTSEPSKVASLYGGNYHHSRTQSGVDTSSSSLQQNSYPFRSHVNTHTSSLLPHGAKSSSNGLSSANADKLDIGTMTSSNMGKPSVARPDPSSIMAPLLAMGFSQRQCDAAILALKNAETAVPSADSGGKHHRDDGDALLIESFRSASGGGTSNTDRSDSLFSSSLFAGQSQGGNVWQNKNDNLVSSLPSNGNNAITNVMSGLLDSNPSHKVSLIGSADPVDGKIMDTLIHSQIGSSSAWGNVAKLKATRTGPEVEDDVVSSLQSINTTSSSIITTSAHEIASSSSNLGQGLSLKTVKVLDIPPELNAFIFHCNANTRDECLERKLFGCPLGGQYGPHSKAKTGDLLFLADFSAWTVTGIFTAKCDAGLNLDRAAWAGKFPWQIRLNEWTTLRTVHIDKVNEILGLASGSKLNMLTKDQLIKLVLSKEFSPCVPPHLYKLKQVNADSISFANALVSQTKELPMTPEKSCSIDSGVRSLTSPSDDPDPVMVNTVATLGDATLSSIANNQRLKQLQASNNHDEHPSTAMHRSKLVSAWIEAFSGEILSANENYNSRRAPQKKDKNLSEEMIKVLKLDCAEPWPVLNFPIVRQAVADLFYRWLLFAHACGNEEGKNARLLSNVGKSVNNAPVVMSYDDSGSWMKQGRSTSSHGKKREDPVLPTLVPGAVEFIKSLLRNTTSTGLAVPTNPIAEVLASKFLHDLEQIASDVRKTQLSSLRVAGENYLKSIEDKALGIRLSELSKYVDNDESASADSTVIKIEWHTKASIAQGRPPQVQKIDKQSFSKLEKTYYDVASGIDPDKTHFLTRLFVLLCRYELIGDVINECQVHVPSPAFDAMCEHFGVAHECFSSPLNRRCPSYNSIFPDSDRYFGSLGSFFDFMPNEGSFFVNPTFDSNIKMVLDHITGLLLNSDSDKNALSFLVLVPSSKDILRHLDLSPFLRNTASVHNSKHSFANTGSDGSQLLELIWLQNDFGYDLWTPTETRVKAIIEGFLVTS